MRGLVATFDNIKFPRAEDEKDSDRNSASRSNQTWEERCKSLRVAVRPPENTLHHITQALVMSTLQSGDGSYAFANRPRPTLNSVGGLDSDSPAQMWARETDQRLLIFGTELWRNPEVYVGSHRATKVELACAANLIG